MILPMQDKSVFEYAVIRIVPRVEREEFMNVGVVLFCAKKNFLQVRFHMDESKISSFVPPELLEEIKGYLHSFEMICRGDDAGGPIALLSIPERFRWLTATRSTVVQTSRVHPGICDDPQSALAHLMEQLVF